MNSAWFLFYFQNFFAEMFNGCFSKKNVVYFLNSLNFIWF